MKTIFLILVLTMAAKPDLQFSRHYQPYIIQDDYVIMAGRYPENVVLCEDAPVRTSPRIDNPPDYVIPAGTPLFIREVGRWSAYGWARIGMPPAWIEMIHICEVR